ncbi:uncharacterized protein KQ657_002920 [Scheffersomyces spartinae]|uniref:Uncharacterized protein n=1 Tax=Scheffersomyces spartinae TaxID=45513 RepID=A0A9P8AGJ0_9ASCO|nr:uncharacterized protein KQ657_002920 [Scheffersomyces spartinae]KAG7191651.1 hypothetical protein KQ657_002920 [Scheffersomyces spartinae]
MIPVSVKIALTLGAVVGAGVAVLHNKEMLFEIMERKLSQGAAYCESQAKRYSTKKDSQLYAEDSDNSDCEPVTPNETDIESDMIDELD